MAKEPTPISITSDEEAEAAQRAVQEYHRQNNEAREAAEAAPYADIIAALQDEGYLLFMEALKEYVQLTTPGSMEQMIASNAVNAMNGVYSQVERRFPSRFAPQPQANLELP